MMRMFELAEFQSSYDLDHLGLRKWERKVMDFSDVCDLIEEMLVEATQKDGINEVVSDR